MMRFALFGPVLLVSLAALAGLWGSLDAYAQGLAVGAIYGGLALLGPALLIGRSAQQGAAGDDLGDWYDLGDSEEWEPTLPLLPPPSPPLRVVSVERPQPKQLTTLTTRKGGRA